MLDLQRTSLLGTRATDLTRGVSDDDGTWDAPRYSHSLALAHTDHTHTPITSKQSSQAETHPNNNNDLLFTIL